MANNMTQDSADFALLASFLANKQSEKQNQTLRLIHDIVTGSETDKSKLTKDLELSVTELKEKHLEDLRILWSKTSYPKQTVSHMVKMHNTYTEEMHRQENVRLNTCAAHIRHKKEMTGGNPNDINAESLGINTSRRPIKRLPPTHIKAESGAHYGVDPQTGITRTKPLLYHTNITDLSELQDVLMYLPNTKHVDFRPSLENIIERAQLLGFGERHYQSVFRILIQKHFPQYNTVFQNSITAEDSFKNMLTIFCSHDVSGTLKDSLRKFCRLPEQSFTEFAAILESIACRTVRETHLQLNQTEANEFARDKLLNYLTSFTGSDTKKLYENQKSTALRSNKEYYSYDGAVLTIFKIEQFIKSPPVTYNMPNELYIQLTSDSSLKNTVMLQAIQLATAQKTQEVATTSETPIFTTGFQTRSNSKDRTNHYQQNPNGYQNRSSFPSPKRYPQPRESRSPRHIPSLDDHRSNPNHTSPHPARQGRSPSRDKRPQSGSRDRSDRPNPPSRPFPNPRQQSPSQPPRFRSKSPGRTAQGYEQRGRSPGKPGQPRPYSGDRKPLQPRGILRENSRDRAGAAGTNPTRDNRPRSKSQEQAGARSNSHGERDGGRARSRDRRDSTRSPSAGRKRFCPYCGKNNCRPGECQIFGKSHFSPYPCSLCPTNLYHRTSSHKFLN